MPGGGPTTPRRLRFRLPADGRCPDVAGDDQPFGGQYLQGTAVHTRADLLQHADLSDAAELVAGSEHPGLYRGGQGGTDLLPG